MSIKVTSKYTKESVKNFGRFNAVKRPSQKIIYIICALVLLGIATMMILTSESMVEFKISLYFILPFMAILIPLTVFITPLLSLKMSKETIGSDLVFDFYEDRLEVTSSKPNVQGHTNANYDFFESVYESEDYLYFYINKRSALVLNKADAQLGQIEQIHELLNSKLEPKKYIRTNKKKLFFPVFTISVLFIALVIFILSSVFFNKEFNNEKVFTADDMSITLTNDFYEKSQVNYKTTYISEEIVIYVIKEDFSFFEDPNISLEEYADIIIYNNEIDSEVKQRDGLTCFTSIWPGQGNPLKNLGVVYRGDNAFWFFQFVCFEDEYDLYEDTIIDFAKSISFGKLVIMA